MNDLYPLPATAVVWSPPKDFEWPRLIQNLLVADTFLTVILDRFFCRIDLQATGEVLSCCVETDGSVTETFQRAARECASRFHFWERDEYGRPKLLTGSLSGEFWFRSYASDQDCESYDEDVSGGIVINS